MFTGRDRLRLSANMRFFLCVRGILPERMRRLAFRLLYAIESIQFDKKNYSAARMVWESELIYAWTKWAKRQPEGSIFS